MKRCMLMLCLSLLLVNGMVNSVHATQLYSANVPFFSDGLDLDTGTVYRDPTVLIVLLGEADEIVQVLKPALANFADFDLAVDIRFDFDAMAVNPIVLVPEDIVSIAVLEDTSFDIVDDSMLTSLSFTSEPFVAPIDYNDVVVLLTAKNNYIKVGNVMQQLDGFGVSADIGRISTIPEPSTMILLGLGLLGIVTIIRRNRKDKFFSFLSLIIIPCVLVVVLMLSGIFFVEEGYSVPVSPREHILQQPDESEFTARQWGDEWVSGWETTSGYSIVREAETGNWVYATRGFDGSLLPSSLVVGEDAPFFYGDGEDDLIEIPKRLRPTDEALQAAQEGGPQLLSEQVPLQAIPSTGTANIPVILINFNDTTTTQTANDFQTLLFGINTNSMRDYYTEVSYGNFSVSPGSGGIAGWYTAAQGHDYYRTHDSAGNQQYTNTRELVEEAVQAADPTVDFSQYDNDDDCYVDTVIIIHQGNGRESSGDNTDIHSHQWAINYTTDDTAACGSIRVGTYTMQPERQDGALVTMGVFTHELGHALGLPDLYDRDYSSEGIGDWGVMAGGSWNGVTRGGDTPAHMSAWSKYFLGWVTPTQVTGTLPNELVDQAATSADVYQLLSGGPPNTNTGEYFLVENRQQTGFDTALPGSGLAIWHIDDSITTQNDQECSPPNNCSSTHYRVALVQADGLWELERNINDGNAGDLYRNPGSTSFDGSTTPASDLYNGSTSNVSVTSISASGSTMTATLSVDTYTISGYVCKYWGEGCQGGIPDVMMSGLPGNPMTDSNGYYNATVGYGWSGTVNPQKEGCSFNPSNRTYSNITTDQYWQYYEGNCDDVDLWIEDTPPDTGEEPNTSGLPMWKSQAIWVRNQPDGIDAHQNPEYGQTNQVYAKVRNRGGTTSAPASIEFYWAYASAGLSWPDKWYLIGTASLSSVAPNNSQTRIVGVPWNPPGTGHYCLVARVVSSEDPMTYPETSNHSSNTKNNNNIAWRNVNVVDLLSNVQNTVRFIVRNITGNITSIDLVFEEEQNLLNDGGRIIVDLGQLFQRWQASGANGTNILLPEGSTEIQLLTTPATITGIQMEADEEQVVRMRAEAFEPMPGAGTSREYDFEMMQVVDGEPVGGVAYTIVTRAQDTDTDDDGIPDVDDDDDDDDGITDDDDNNPLDPEIGAGGVIIKKQGTGNGSILVGDQECDSACIEMTVPYSGNTALILKAIPDADSYFVRWEAEDGSVLSGTFQAKPGDIVIAIFNKKP